MVRVVKIGGNVIDNPQLLASFLADFAAIPGQKVLVHGGGVMASRMQQELGMEPVMVEGRRVTDGETLRIVTMVYAGWCNKSITAALQAKSCNAIGLSGCDANIITAAKRAPKLVNGQEVDYGFVGDVISSGVDGHTLKLFLDNGITPVFCAINHDGRGNLLNTNADTIAQSVAVCLAKEAMDVQLIYCFEKAGVLMDKDDENSLIRQLSQKDFLSLKEQGKVADGMIPKLENAFKAISEGVRSVRICHAQNLNNGTGTILE